MSNIHQSSNRTKNRPWAALLPVLLLAPLAMAPKGCGPVVVGDECPNDTVCTAGTAGGDPTPSAGAAGHKPTGSGGSAGSKPSGNGGSAGGVATGKACGGLLGLSCAATDYCAFDPAAACGAADQTGVCTPRPQICDAIAAPVCGCDGQTYSSDCVAATNGSGVLHTGACDTSSGNTCGGLIGGTCAKSEYCSFPIGSQCGSADQTGICAKIPDACTEQYDPVCGCDDATYGNACAAAAKGVSILHTGACEGSTPGAVCGGLRGLTCPDGAFCNFPIEAKCGAGDQTGTCDSSLAKCSTILDPVCGCDGKTYDNSCIAHSQKVSVAATGACSTTCGGKRANTSTCASNEYCNYPSTANCGRADATGTCTAKLTGACITLYDPVCGCDGKTYGNSCEAGNAGMSVDHTGACP